MTEIKNTIVYRVQPWQETEYLVTLGETAEKSTWSTNKANAKLFVHTRAYNISKRFNGHLDRGVAKRYGWGQ